MSAEARVHKLHASLENRRGERVVVAWSGGLDSTVLLHLARRHGLDVLAVHVDHQLRPSSGRDAAFCARQAREWGISLENVRIRIRGGGSSQERARLQRYAALARASRAAGARLVLTAHHGEDALETALLNRERGAGLFGLTSLLRSDRRGPIPSWPADISLERPLLGVLRRDIEAYAREHALTWVEDPTNAETGYRRNEIRHELLPRLTDDGARTRSWLETLEQMAEQAASIDARARSIVSRATFAPIDAESRAMHTRLLAGVDEQVRARALLALASSTDCALRSDHVDALAGAIRDGGDERLSIPGGVATLADDLIFIERARGRGGRHLADRCAPQLALSDTEPAEFAWFDTRVSVENATSRVESAPIIRGAECLLTGGARRIGHRAIPGPLMWRWPKIVGEDASWTLGPEPVFLRLDGGQLAAIRWEFDADTVWRHVCGTVEAPRNAPPN